MHKNCKSHRPLFKKTKSLNEDDPLSVKQYCQEVKSWISETLSDPAKNLKAAVNKINGIIANNPYLLFKLDQAVDDRVDKYYHKIREADLNPGYSTEAYMITLIRRTAIDVVERQNKNIKQSCTENTDNLLFSRPEHDPLLQLEGKEMQQWLDENLTERQNAIVQDRLTGLYDVNKLARRFKCSTKTIEAELTKIRKIVGKRVT